MCHATSAGRKAGSVSTNKSQFVDALSMNQAYQRNSLKCQHFWPTEKIAVIWLCFSNAEAFSWHRTIMSQRRSNSWVMYNFKYKNHWSIYGTLISFKRDQSQSAKNIILFSIICSWLAVCVNYFVFCAIEIKRTYENTKTYIRRNFFNHYNIRTIVRFWIFQNSFAFSVFLFLFVALIL